jgi:hypothetical protein
MDPELVAGLGDKWSLDNIAPYLPKYKGMQHPPPKTGNPQVLPLLAANSCLSVSPSNCRQRVSQHAQHHNVFHACQEAATSG